MSSLSDLDIIKHNYHLNTLKLGNNTLTCFIISRTNRFQCRIKKGFIFCKVSAFGIYGLLLRQNVHWSGQSLHYKEYTGLLLPLNYQRQTARWRTVCGCGGGLNYTVHLHRNMNLRNTTITICQPWTFSSSHLRLKRTGTFLNLWYLFIDSAHQGQNTAQTWDFIQWVCSAVIKLV